jgi:hypothetical protein
LAQPRNAEAIERDDGSVKLDGGIGRHRAR